MKLIGRVVITFIAGAVAVWLTSRFIEGFKVESTIGALLTVAALLTLINVFFRPFIKLIFSPFIIITLGLFNLVINAGLLYVLDILSDNLTIAGLTPLLYATLIITAVNIVINYSAKH